MILKLLFNTRMIWMIFINIEEYLNKKSKMLIDFYDMTGDMFTNKKT